MPYLSWSSGTNSFHRYFSLGHYLQILNAPPIMLSFLTFNENQTEMDWKEFETIVRWVYERMGTAFGVQIVGYGPKNRHKGISGVAHQIDVLTSHSDGLHTLLTAIECKWWNKKVTAATVTHASHIKDDCKFNNSVIVTKVGFTKAAIKTAANKNIQLVELKEYNLQISDDTLTKVYMHFKVKHPELIDVKIISDQATVIDYIDHPILSADDRYLYTPQKERLEMNQLINDFLNKKVLVSQHHNLIIEERTFDRGTILKSRSIHGNIPVEGIQFTGYNRMYTKLDTEYFKLKIWLALKLIFEKKQFSVTTSGEIVAWDNGEPLQLTKGRIVRLEAICNARQFKINKNFRLLDTPLGSAGKRIEPQ